jgi:phage repressor protein C with HTH and peptisase S24 domain
MAIAGAERASFVLRLQLVVGSWPSVVRLAKAAGVSPSAFRKWLKGESEPSRDRLVALARVAGISLAWLASGEGPEPVFPAAPPGAQQVSDRNGLESGAFLMLPSYAVSASAGAGRQPLNTATHFIGFRHDWLHANFGLEPSDVQLESVVGDSMEPHIHDGDILLVNTTDQTFRNHGIYVIVVRNERLVKRVQRRFDGSLTLISDNQKYQAEHIPSNLAEEITVVGQVIWRGGSI